MQWLAALPNLKRVRSIFSEVHTLGPLASGSDAVQVGALSLARIYFFKRRMGGDKSNSQKEYPTKAAVFFLYCTIMWEQDCVRAFNVKLEGRRLRIHRKRSKLTI